MNDIEILSEQLGSLQIIEKALNEYKQTDIEILAASATNKNIQAIMPKSMVPDPGWFNRD